MEISSLNVALYKKICRSAFGKSQKLWNVKSKSTQAADAVKGEFGVLLSSLVATRCSLVYDVASRLVVIIQDPRQNY